MFAVTNVETLHDQQIVVVHTYEGMAIKNLKDELIFPYESDAHIIDILQGLGVTEVWTADHLLATALLATPGLHVSIKHRLDVMETRKAVERSAEALITALDIEVQPPAPELAAWRKYVITKLGGIIK